MGLNETEEVGWWNNGIMPSTPIPPFVLSASNLQGLDSTQVTPFDMKYGNFLRPFDRH
jgi:hypothetical protein